MNARRLTLIAAAAAVALGAAAPAAHADEMTLEQLQAQNINLRGQVKELKLDLKQQTIMIDKAEDLLGGGDPKRTILQRIQLVSKQLPGTGSILRQTINTVGTLGKYVTYDQTGNGNIVSKVDFSGYAKALDDTVKLAGANQDLAKQLNLITRDSAANATSLQVINSLVGGTGTPEQSIIQLGNILDKPQNITLIDHAKALVEEAKQGGDTAAIDAELGGEGTTADRLAQLKSMAGGTGTLTERLSKVRALLGGSGSATARIGTVVERLGHANPNLPLVDQLGTASDAAAANGSVFAITRHRRDLVGGGTWDTSGTLVQSIRTVGVD